MADKGKRVASRQAQLKRKKRRGKGRAAPSAATPTGRRAVEETTAEAAVPAVAQPTAPAASQPAAPAANRPSEPRPAPAQPQSPRPTPAASPARRTVAAARSEAVLTHPHLAVELRHIGAITVVIAAALAVLTVFLR